MAISNHTPADGDFKDSPEPTPKELYLTLKHGNLHEIIPPALNKRNDTLQAIAYQLNVSPMWVTRWLERHGYVKRYVRTEEGGAE